MDSQAFRERLEGALEVLTSSDVWRSHKKSIKDFTKQYWKCIKETNKSREDAERQAEKKYNKAKRGVRLDDKTTRLMLREQFQREMQAIQHNWREDKNQAWAEFRSNLDHHWNELVKSGEWVQYDQAKKPVSNMVRVNGH